MWQEINTIRVQVAFWNLSNYNSLSLSLSLTGVPWVENISQF